MIAGKRTSGAVGAVQSWREADDYDARSGSTEGRHRTRPVPGMPFPYTLEERSEPRTARAVRIVGGGCPRVPRAAHSPSARAGPAAPVVAAALAALGDEHGELERLLMIETRIDARAIGARQVGIGQSA